MMSEKKSSDKRRLVKELHAPARRNFPRVIVCGCDYLWQTDLVDILTRDSIEVITTFSPLSMCWASMHELYHSRL